MTGGWDRPLMTLFTDASLCHLTRAAGWGAWVKVDGWDAGRTLSGTVPHPILSSGEAELWGAALALEEIAQRCWLADARTVMLQCDSLEMLELLVAQLGARVWDHDQAAPVGRSGATPSLSARDALRRIRTSLGGSWLLVRHVRGHRTGGDRHWVNRKCDRLAKTEMRRRRELVRMGALQTPQSGV